MPIQVTGYEVIKQQGSVSQAVTVPATTDYCVHAIISDQTAAVSNVTLDAVAFDDINTSNAGWPGTNQIHGVATSPGNPTFTRTLSGNITTGGASILVYLSGVDTHRDNTAGGLNAAGLWTTAGMESNLGDLGLIIAFHDSLSLPGGQSFDYQGQTTIFDNDAYQNRGYGAAYLDVSVSGSLSMQTYGDWPAGSAVTLIPKPEDIKLRQPSWPIELLHRAAYRKPQPTGTYKILSSRIIRGVK